MWRYYNGLAKKGLCTPATSHAPSSYRCQGRGERRANRTKTMDPTNTKEQATTTASKTMGPTKVQAATAKSNLPKRSTPCGRRRVLNESAVCGGTCIPPSRYHCVGDGSEVTNKARCNTPSGVLIRRAPTRAASNPSREQILEQFINEFESLVGPDQLRCNYLHRIQDGELD